MYIFSNPVAIFWILYSSLTNFAKGDIIVSVNDNDDIDKISNIVYTYQGNQNSMVTIKYYRYNITTLRWVQNDIVIELVNYIENLQNTFI